MARTATQIERARQAIPQAVKLGSGEEVSLAAYRSLSREDKAKLQELGIEAFVQEKEQQQAQRQAEIGAQQADLAANYVKLPTGEYVTKVEFEALTPEQQEQLKAVGVEQFEVLQGAELAKFEAEHVKLDNGEWILKTDFDALTIEQQAQLKQLGVDGFNAAETARQKEFEATHVKLDNGEWVEKEGYDALAEYDKYLLRTMGVEPFNSMAATRYQAYQDTLTRIEPYKTDEGYDLVEMAMAGFTRDDIIGAGFDASDAGNAVNYAAGLKELDKYKQPDGQYDMVSISRDYKDGKVSFDAIFRILGQAGASSATFLTQDLEIVLPFKIEGTNDYDLVKLCAEMDRRKDDVWASVAADAVRRLFGEDALVEAMRFYDENIAVGPGQWVPKTEWDALTIDQRNTVLAQVSEQRLAPSTEVIPESLTGVAQQYETILPIGYVGPVQPNQARAEDVFQQMVQVGEIPEKATIVSFNADTDEFTYKLPPREQFDSWKATDLNAPADAVYEGESEDGGFIYSSPSAAIVTVETAEGTKDLKLSEWEKMSEMEQYEFILGRPPILTEWVAYCLAREGAELNFSITAMPGLRTIQGAFESLFIPGEQKTEKWLRVSDEATKEWYRAYPKLAKEGIVSTSFEELGFPAVKAMYPQIAIKDITGKEWAMTGVSIALWTLPLWLPKALAGIKAVGKAAFKVNIRTRTPIVRFQSPIKRVDLGLSGVRTSVRSPITIKLGAGLQRVGLTAKVEEAAFRAGSAATELKAATLVASKTKLVGVRVPGEIVTTMGKRVVVSGTGESVVGGMLPAKIASRLKIAQVNSFNADMAFTRTLSGLKLTAKQIKLLEKATGFKGLLKPIRNIGTAVKTLKTAWGTASEAHRTVSQTAEMFGQNSSNYRAAMRSYIKSLNKVSRARTALDKAVSRLDNKLIPRYTEAPHAGWTKVLSSAESELARAQKALNRALGIKARGEMMPSKVAKLIEETTADLANAQARLNNLLELKASGAYPPEVAGWKMAWEKGGATPEGYTPEGPAKGGFGKEGSMPREFYEQLYDKMVKGWQEPQPWAYQGERVPGRVIDASLKGLKPFKPSATVVSGSKAPVATAVETPTLQASLFELPKYEVPTLSSLRLVARYAEQLATQMKKAGYPELKVGRMFPKIVTTALPKIAGTVPVIIPATVATTINRLGITPQQLSGKVSLTPAQVTPVSNMLGVKPATVTKLSSTGELSETLVERMYAVGGQIAQLTEPQTNELVSVLADTWVQPITTTQVQALAEVLDLTETATQTLLRTMTELVTETATATELATQTATATETEAATKTETKVATAVTTGLGKATEVAEGISVKPSLGLILPSGGEVEQDERGRPVVPGGTYTWLQGIGWRSLLPPYTAKKPLWSKLPPKGARVGGRTPAETIQVVNPTGKEPKSISVDLGVTDIFIKGGGKGVRPTIEFKAHGMKTDVGTRIPGPEKGLSLGDEPTGLLLDEEPVGMPEMAVKAVSQRSQAPKKRGKRRSWLDEVGSLKGYRF